jgi:hypothetical protein
MSVTIDNSYQLANGQTYTPWEKGGGDNSALKYAQKAIHHFTVF